MTDRATPNLPSRNFTDTETFYCRAGFTTTFKDAHWLIMVRGDLTLEFFPHPGLDPDTSWFSCCLRLDDVDTFYAVLLAAGIEEKRSGLPRLHPPEAQPSGMKIGALLDGDGTLIRLIGN
ncbi:bleomycin resistance protein [Erwinia persicina]